MTTPARKRTAAGSTPDGSGTPTVGEHSPAPVDARALPGLAVSRSADGPGVVVQRSVLGKLKSKINGSAKKAGPIKKVGPIKAPVKAPAPSAWGAATPKRNANNAGPRLATSRANARPIEQEQAEQEHGENSSGGYSSHLEAGPLRGDAAHYSEVIPANNQAQPPGGGYSSHLEAGPLRGDAAATHYSEVIPANNQAQPPGGGYASHLDPESGPSNARANHYSEVIPLVNGEQEQPEQQDEPSHYNTDPIAGSSNATHYSEVIPLANGAQPGEQQQPEQQDEPSHYNTDPIVGSSNATHYSEVIPLVNDAQPGEQQQAEQEGQDAGPQRPLPSMGRKRPPGDGTARKHRAFQVNALGTEYGNEKASVSGHLKGAIVGAVKTVKKYYAWTSQNSYSDSDRLELLGRMTNNGLNVNDSTPDKVLHDFAVRRHKEELEKLRREELDITDAGILMHTTANGREPYPTEDGQPDGDPIVEDRLVKYDETAESQEKTLVEVRGGAVYRSQAADDKGAKVDTAKSVTHFSGAGYEIFVVDDKNQIHMASHKLGKYHHSSLLAGGNVSMAGEMKVVDGKIVYMSNKSGHYVPTLTNFLQFLHFLEKDGVPLDFEVALLGGPTAGKFPAKDLVAGKSSAAGGANKNKTYEVLKTNAVWKSFVDEFGEDAVEAVIEQQGWERFGRDITDADGNDVDLKLVRRLLKQQLKGGGRANVIVDKH